MDNCNSFTISNQNEFRSSFADDNYGVVVTNSDIVGGDVFKNVFDGTETGFQTEFDNSNLQIRCNEFQNHLNAWRINPAASPGALENQGTGCDPQLEIRAGNQFLDNICASQQHILSSLGFTYYGSQSSVNPYPDPQVSCSDAPPVSITYCIIDPVDEHSCDDELPPGNNRTAWFELIENTEDSIARQQLWQTFLREIIALDTLDQDSTIVTFMDSLNSDVSKWYKITWYLDKYDLVVADSLLSIVTLDNLEDSSLFEYNNFLFSMLNSEGNFLTLNGDRIIQLNGLLNSTATVSKRAAAMLEIAGIQKFEYEPEQVPELRINNNQHTEIGNIMNSRPRILVYPNPSNGIFMIKLIDFKSENKTFTFEIYNSVGELLNIEVEQINTSNKEFQVNLSEYTPGFYYGKVSYDDMVLYGKMHYME